MGRTRLLAASLASVSPSDPGTHARLPGNVILQPQDKGIPCQLLLPLVPKALTEATAHFDPRSFSSLHCYIVFLSSIRFIESLKAQRLYKLLDEGDLAVASLRKLLIVRRA